MLQRIDAHLQEPEHRLIARSNALRKGSVFTAVGLPVLSATVEGDKLTITAPMEGEGISGDELLALLRNNFSMSLTLAED